MNENFPLFPASLLLLAAVGTVAASAAAPARNDWYRDSLVNLHIDNHGRLVGKGRSADEIAAQLRTLPVDVVQVSAYGADGAVTTYPGALLARDDLEGWDTLAVWKEAIQRAGKRFHVYLNTRGLSITTTHPGWTQLDAAGKGKGRNDGLDVCARSSADGSGYLEALLLPLVEEIMKRYRPDGIWVDGDHARTRACYCRHCKAAWHALSGKAEPPVDAGDPDWPRWLALEQERYDEYRRRMAETVHRLNPGALYTSNHSWKKAALVFEKDDPRSAPPFADTISADLSHGQALWITRSKALFLSAERNTPWDIMNLIYKPSEIARRRVLQQGAVTIAHGGSWFLWLPGQDPLAPEAFARALECARFVRDRARALGRSGSINPVAVLLSETAWQRERTGGYAGFAGLVEAQRWALMLEDACFGVDLINETDLAGGTSQYRVIVVPDQRAVSAATLERLREFATAGGTLLLTGSALRAGEREEEDFTALTGVVREGRQDAALTLTAGSKPVCCDSRWTLAQCDAEVLAHWDDGRPLMTARPLGRGRAVYVSSGDLPVPDYDGLVPHLLDRCGFGPAVRLSGPGRKEHFIVSFRQKGGQAIVHLTGVGSSVNGVRRAEEITQLIDEAPPVPEVTVHLPSPEPAAVSVVPATATVEHSWQDGILSATIRNLNLHAALILETPPALPIGLLPPGVPLEERHPLSHYERWEELEEGFEIASRGQVVTLAGPYDLRFKGRTAAGISGEAASSGSRSLKFTDAPCVPPYLPMLCVKPRLRLPLLFSCDLKIEDGAKVWLDFREQENRKDFPAGPSVTFDAKTGKITAARKEVGGFPVGAWFTLEVELPADGKASYRLRVQRGEGQPSIQETLPFDHPEFSRCGWIGVIGTGNEAARFFLDNLKIRRADGRRE